MASSGYRQERIFLNDFRELTRTSKKGKVTRRVSIEIKSEPLLHTFDDFLMGSGPADAIKDAIAKGIKNVTKIVSPATLVKRKWAQGARAKKTNTYKRRYLRGRKTTLAEPQVGAVRWLNDSGKMAKGIFVRQNRNQATYTINVPAARLNQDEWGTNGLPFQQFLAEFKKLVPALDAKSLQQMPGVEKAIRESINLLIVKAKDVRKAKLEQLKRARLALIKTAFQAAGFG